MVVDVYEISIYISSYLQIIFFKSELDSDRIYQRCDFMLIQ